MAKKTEGTFFNKAGEPVWMFDTKYKAQHGYNEKGEEIWCGDAFVLYDFTADQEYASLLTAGQKGELGELMGAQGKVMGETKHTQEMHDRSALAVADRITGVITTSNRAVAKKIAKEVDSAVLRPGCDTSILDEVQEKKAFDKKTPAERAQDAIEARAKAPAPKV